MLLLGLFHVNEIRNETRMKPEIRNETRISNETRNVFFMIFRDFLLKKYHKSLSSVS